MWVYVLFFGTGMVFALIARRMGAWSYKAGVGVALVAGFALGWSNMVHVADSGNPANLMYYSVLGVGAVGACLARLKARGLALTLFAMAATLALIAVTLPSGAPPYLARNMAIGHGVFVALFTASGLLFRHASLAGLQIRDRGRLQIGRRFDVRQVWSGLSEQRQEALRPRRNYNEVLEALAAAGRWKADRPANREYPFSRSSIRRNWLNFATRSLRQPEPVLMWPAPVATVRSAMKVSSVSPDRWETKHR